ncbi:MAG TPA: thiamine pyrophosphate-binding protein, partial [Polyangiaceae bacterium]|nr:thiamine pyrophosphate-binding protein [Polyangiaceae bacterium]
MSLLSPPRVRASLARDLEASVPAADAQALRALQRPEPSAPQSRAQRCAARAPANGAEFVVQELERRGINTVIGIPGGAILPLYDALAQSQIRHVLARHEQGAGFIAHGMARATGNAAVCLATSGPGVTNLITALADARADSVPIVAITAQVPRALIGTDAFQEVDTCALARPVTKASFFASSAAELARLLPYAFELATRGRPGPVLIDIPKDVFKEPLPEPSTRNAPPLPPASPSLTGHVQEHLDASQASTWRRIAGLLRESQRPLLYIGGGIHMSGAHAALAELARRADVPMVSSLHGLGSFPGDDPRWLGMLGM